MGNRHVSSRVWTSLGSGSSYMGNMQCNVVQTKTTRTSIYNILPLHDQIILYLQMATMCNHKISQNMGFFTKKPFKGPKFFNPERGAIDTGGHDSSFRGGIGGGGGGHWQSGGWWAPPCVRKGWCSL